MSVRNRAKRSAWCLACLLAGCVQPAVQQSSGTFGRSGIDLFREPVASTKAEPASEINTPTAKAVEIQVGSEHGHRNPQSNPQSKPRTATAPQATTPSGNEPAVDAIRASATTSQPPQFVDAAIVRPQPATNRQKERELRNAFANATASGQAQAALNLAGYLVQQERHDAALFVIDAAIERQRTTALRIARANLLRDIARCDLAMSELRDVVREVGIDKVSPSTLFDLAQIEWVNGDARAAASTLSRMQHEYAGDSWLQDHADEIQEWYRRITTMHASRDSLANGEMRDLFALLRAAPDISGRLKLLDSLAKPSAEADGTSDGRHPIRIRAIAIACADEATAVRARAVQLAASNGVTDLSFWQAALKDTAPTVRRFAASGAVNQHNRLAAPILLAAIEQEQDPEAFAALHKSLAKALSIAVPVIDKNSPNDRSAAARYWKTQLDQNGL